MKLKLRSVLKIRWDDEEIISKWNMVKKAGMITAQPSFRKVVASSFIRQSNWGRILYFSISLFLFFLFRSVLKYYCNGDRQSCFKITILGLFLLPIKCWSGWNDAQWNVDYAGKRMQPNEFNQRRNLKVAPNNWHWERRGNLLEKGSNFFSFFFFLFFFTDIS